MFAHVAPPPFEEAAPPPRAHDRAEGTAPEPGLPSQFFLFGTDVQILQVELAQSDQVLGPSRSFVYRGQGIVETDQQPGVLAALGRAMRGGAGTWKGNHLVQWKNCGAGPSYLGLSAAVPGKIVPVDLQRAGTVLVKRECFVCSLSGSTVEPHDVRVSVEDFPVPDQLPMLKVRGTGLCFIHAGGAAVEKVLKEGEHLFADLGCIAGLSDTCKLSAPRAAMLSRNVPHRFAYMAKVTGPGTVYIQCTYSARQASADSHYTKPQRVSMADNLRWAFTLLLLVLVLLTFLEEAEEVLADPDLT